MGALSLILHRGRDCNVMGDTSREPCQQQKMSASRDALWDRTLSLSGSYIAEHSKQSVGTWTKYKSFGDIVGWDFYFRLKYVGGNIGKILA